MTDNQNTLSSQSIQDAFSASFPQSHNTNVIRSRLVDELTNLPTVQELIMDNIKDVLSDYFFQKFSLPADDEARKELEHKHASALLSEIEDIVIDAYNKYASDEVDALLEDCNENYNDEAA